MIKTTIKGFLLLVPLVLWVMKSVGAMAISHCHKFFNEDDILVLCE
jgi:hypothetical protein